MTSEVDYHDVVLLSGERGRLPNESTLPQVVAAGRLFILNGAGEFEQVTVAMYERLGGYMGVCDDGYEYDEDGNVTREFQPGRRPT